MKIIANNYKPKEIIKIIREWTELTQEKFGKSIGRSKNTVQSYELGRNKMTLDKFMEIAKEHNLVITIEKK
ncbi:MAG: helix-turn-helix transcriptional regulator [Bacilli bacterium]|nr:helix-turn-helix transcriptional regulator [Bacilli bacterium]